MCPGTHARKTLPPRDKASGALALDYQFEPRLLGLNGPDGALLSEEITVASPLRGSNRRSSAQIRMAYTSVCKIVGGSAEGDTL